MAKLVCWNCGEDLDDVPRPISRHATCGKCFSELHCCRMCRRFNPNSTGQCEDDRSDPPVYKDNANFCEFFSPLFGAYGGARGDRRDAAREKLEGLFGGAAVSSAEADDDEGERPATPEEIARKKLDDLFGGSGGEKR